jgi:hypothetical protein
MARNGSPLSFICSRRTMLHHTSTSPCCALWSRGYRCAVPPTFLDLRLLLTTLYRCFEPSTLSRRLESITACPLCPWRASIVYQPGGTGPGRLRPKPPKALRLLISTITTPGSSLCRSIDQPRCLIAASTGIEAFEACRLVLPSRSYEA